MTYHMEKEIATQDRAWTEALNALEERREELTDLLERHRKHEIRFLGAGSSYCGALTAARYWARHGFRTLALQPSEQLFHAEAYPFDEPPLAIALTRSGATTEINEALRKLKGEGATCLALTTTEGSDVEAIVDHTVAVPFAREGGIVQTRSFTTLLVAAQGLLHTLTDSVDTLRPLSEGVDGWLERSRETIIPLVSPYRRLYVMGTGEHWGVALESALLLKETALVEAEGFQTFEFRHGPQSMIDEETLLVCYTHTDHADMETVALKEFEKIGATVLAIGKGASGLDIEGHKLDVDTPLSDAQVSARLILPVQLLAFQRCVEGGLDPDKPRHLQFAIQFTDLRPSK